MTTVAIYTRLSDTDTPAEQTATHRQQTACESFAGLRGWEVVRVFEDVDFSAYTRNLRRPAYEEMLDAVRAKRFDGIIGWKLDRFVRRSAEFERLWDACDRSGVFLTSVTEPIDTSTDLGLAMVRVLVAFASLESANMGVRLTAKMRERAEAGLPHTGQAAYGHKKGWHEVEPEQADRIREAARRFLDGESVRSIVMDWNERGVATMTGAKWSVTALREVLMSPRLAGLRRYRGEVIGRGDWPAILDEATWREICEVYEARRRGKVDPRTRSTCSSGCCGAACADSTCTCSRRKGRRRSGSTAPSHQQGAGG